MLPSLRCRLLGARTLCRSAPGLREKVLTLTCLTSRIPAICDVDCAFIDKACTMESFRQRRISNRIATRSHTTKSAEPEAELTDTPAQPAAKRRKTSAATSNKGLNAHAAAQRQNVDSSALAEQATSSADTVFDAIPTVSSAPSGLPASIPAHVPADPDVLHCWTKDSMAKAAAYLAERDAGV